MLALKPLLLVSILLGHVLGSYAQKQRLFFNERVYRNGPYVFLACNESQGPAVADLFEYIGGFLDNVLIPDAQQGTSQAFTTFFPATAAGTVTSVLKDIKDMAIRNSVTGKALKPTRVFCANEENKAVTFIFTDCVLNENIIALFDTYSQWVTLCPNFWTHPTVPNYGDCPSLNHMQTRFVPTGVAEDSGGMFRKNQFATIVHELAHKHVSTWSVFEKHDINTCAEADDTIRLNNPANYAYYACFLLARCDRYPNYDEFRRHRSRKMAAYDPFEELLSQSYNDNATFGRDLEAKYPNVTNQLAPL